MLTLTLGIYDGKSLMPDFGNSHDYMNKSHWVDLEDFHICLSEIERLLVNINFYLIQNVT